MLQIHSRVSHRVVSLIDAKQEDELGEEECCYQVFVDGVEVGAEPAQEAQQDEREEEQEQRDCHCGVGDDLQRENIAMLWREEGQLKRKYNQQSQLDVSYIQLR